MEKKELERKEGENDEDSVMEKTRDISAEVITLEPDGNLYSFFFNLQ